MNKKNDASSMPPDVEVDQNTKKTNKWKKMRENAKDNSTVEPTNSAFESTDNKEQKSSETESDAEAINVERFLEENQKLSKELEAAKTELQYAKAAEQNNARRHQNELTNARLYAGLETVKSFVTLLDSLEAAHLQSEEVTLDQLKEGTQNILALIHSIFKKLGVKEIEPAIGETFDPNVHSAIATEVSTETDQASDTIIKMLRKGYLLHDRLIRPAMVTISQAKE